MCSSGARDWRVDDLLDLVGRLVDTLTVALVELEQLDEAEIPLPDRVVEQLCEHAAMKRTLARLIDGSTAPAKIRDRAQVVYREEMARASASGDGGRVPVGENVLDELREVEEDVRRRRLVNDLLYDGLVVHVLDL